MSGTGEFYRAIHPSRTGSAEVSQRILDDARRDAVIIVAAINRLVEETEPTPNAAGQRFVPLRAVRAAVGLPEYRFDAAVAYLAEEHKVWLRVDQHSTADDDRASVRHQGTDYHQISADNWRTA